MATPQTFPDVYDNRQHLIKPTIIPQKYALVPLQEPEICRSCGFGDKEVFRPIDPPPVLQLGLVRSDGTVDLRLPNRVEPIMNMVVHVSLISETGDDRNLVLLPNCIRNATRNTFNSLTYVPPPTFAQPQRRFNPSSTSIPSATVSASASNVPLPITTMLPTYPPPPPPTEAPTAPTISATPAKAEILLPPPQVTTIPIHVKQEPTSAGSHGTTSNALTTAQFSTNAPTPANPHAPPAHVQPLLDAVAAITAAAAAAAANANNQQTPAAPLAPASAVPVPATIILPLVSDIPRVHSNGHANTITNGITVADHESEYQPRYLRTIVGSLVSPCYMLTDINGQRGGFFVFADLGIRIEGKFKLKFTLTDLSAVMQSPFISHPTTDFTSNLFNCYTTRDFPGMMESTDLIKHFADQGLKIPIRNKSRQKGGSQHSSSTGGRSGRSSVKDEFEEVEAEPENEDEDRSMMEADDEETDQNAVGYY